MDPERHDSMPDCRLLGKDAEEKRQPASEPDEPSDYYYDDAHGYRIYESDTPDDDDDTENDDSGS